MKLIQIIIHAVIGVGEFDIVIRYLMCIVGIHQIIFLTEWYSMIDSSIGN